MLMYAYLLDDGTEHNPAVKESMPLCCAVPALQLVKVANKAGSQEQQQLPVSVRAQLALLSQQWPVAEALLLAQGQVDETIALYQQAHRCVTHHTCSDCVHSARLVVSTTYQAAASHALDPLLNAWFSRLCRWDDAIRVADTSRHPQTEQLKHTYHEWLTTTGQYDKAASIKEREGDPLGAVYLCLRGGMPARAAQVGQCPRTATNRHRWSG